MKLSIAYLALVAGVVSAGRPQLSVSQLERFDDILGTFALSVEICDGIVRLSATVVFACCMLWKYPATMTPALAICSAMSHATVAFFSSIFYCVCPEHDHQRGA